MLTSEALLPCLSSRHHPPLATPRAHSTSQPHTQWSTGGDLRSLVGCHPKETLHCCWVNSVVFSSACTDWTYAGHHLLLPRLTSMLAKSWSQIEWAPPTREQITPTFLHQSSYVDSLTFRALIRTASGKGGRRNTKTEATMSVSWRATEAETFFHFIMQWSMRMKMITNDAMAVHFWSETMLTVIIILVLTRSRNCSTCSAGQKIRATPSKMHPWSGWSSAVWFQPSPWTHSTPSSG